MKAQWRAVQTAFQYSARVGIAASAVILKELRKTAKEDLVFHSFNYNQETEITWDKLVAVHLFGDAGHNNRPDGGAAGGYITGFADPHILNGKEAKMSILDWRSWKLDRPVKGTNGSESQGVYEDDWKCRIFWSLINGQELTRSNAKQLASMTESLLVTDSRGLYDAIASSDSPLLGMNNSRTGLETTAVQKGVREDGRCYLTWVPSDMNLADCLTKATTEAFRVAALCHARKAWVVRFNEEFVSARKQQRLRRTREGQDVVALAVWPSDEYLGEIEGLSTNVDR